MKLTKTLLVPLVLCSTLIFATGCNGEDSTETQEQLIGTVTIGDLSTDVSAVGNLALSEKENLTFDLAGTVTDVLVEVGDLVEEGELLAKLDTSEKDESIDTLTKTIEQKDQALLQAELNLNNAQESLDELYDQRYIDIKTAEAELNVYNVQIALENAEEAYERAEEHYENNWTIPDNIRNYEMATIRLEIAQLNLEEAQAAVGKVLTDIETQREIKEKELVLVQRKFDDAQKEYDDAVAELKEAKIQSYELSAPYAGYITKVSITEGQQVQKNASAIEIADPDKFEADVLVGEMDIFNIAIGTTAMVQVDAMQTVTLPAQVSYISPTATIQSGVVSYSVKVELMSTDMMATAGQFDMMPQVSIDGNMEAIEPGELPQVLQNAVEAGRMTEEEAESMMDMMQSGNFTGRPGEDGMIAPPTDGEEGFITPFGDGERDFGDRDFGGMAWADAAANQTMGISTGDSFSLREGLTVTVSIITETKYDVLLVPSNAITTYNGQNTVTVVNEDGTTEQRVITTGLNDWQNTEVLSGLAEGEQVIVTATSTEQSSWDMPGGTVIFRDVTSSGGPMR